MGKLNRGNLLATLKKLKKMPRPKVVIANPAVQAICGGSSITPNKKADLKAVIERRRAILQGRAIASVGISYMEQYDDEMNDFLEQLRVMKALRSSKNNEAV